MPELPDVELYIEALTTRVLGERLIGVRLTSPFLLRSVEPTLGDAAGRGVTGLRRLGKRIVFELDGELFLVLHLMIAGRLRWKAPGVKIPRKLGLAAFEDDPGLQCRLYALLPASQLMEDQAEEDEEPWAASVPRFEDVMEQSESDEREEAIVPLLLGHIVRFARDRKHPDDLAAEAADILRAILSEDRPLTDVVDKILEDL